MDEQGNLLIADTGNSVIREVSVASSTLDFGTVTVGQIGGPISVLVSNVGDEDLDVGTIGNTGPFSIQATCAAGVAVKPGAYCSIEISFIPTASGQFAGTVSLGDNAAGNPHTINLKGQGYVVPVASHLVFATQFSNLPYNGNLGLVTVNAEDGNGNLVTGFTATVALQIQGPPAFTPFSTNIDAAGGAAMFDLTAPAFNVEGQYTITASSSGLTSAQGSFMVAGPKDFAVSVSPQSLAIVSGATGRGEITVSPANGFTGAITLNCSGLPAHSTCSFAPSSLNADGTNAALLSTLTISTGLASVASSQPPSRLALIATGTGVVSFCALGMAFVPLRNERHRGRRSKHHLISLATIILILGLVGCGSVQSRDGSPLTPRGSYKVTVAASSGSISHATTLTVTVQ